MPASDLISMIPDASGWVDCLGFQAGNAACDIRRASNPDRLDLCILFSDRPCAAASVYTLNQVFAAPVKLCREIRDSGQRCRAIVANSGNANACTGEQGERDARLMQEWTARRMNVCETEVLVASTGRIGEDLPMDRVEDGIRVAAENMGADDGNGRGAAMAILTSDTREKIVACEVRAGERGYRISSIAKGAGMIQPGMATMLCFISTDADVPADFLQAALNDAVDGSFNAITVDGDMSTNDSVILFANGASEVAVSSTEERELFRAALARICRLQAEKIVGDGEKISKVVSIDVSGTSDDRDAEKIARAIGNSLLVKSSWFGGDPNWGRILDAAGYAGVSFDLSSVRLDYAVGREQVSVFADGRAIHANKPRWKELVTHPRFTIKLRLGTGAGEYSLLASDLTEGYVRFNKSE